LFFWWPFAFIPLTWWRLGRPGFCFDPICHCCWFCRFLHKKWAV
jgi:hypothetical protein